MTSAPSMIGQAQVEQDQGRQLLRDRAQPFLARCVASTTRKPSTESDARRNRRIGASSSITAISGSVALIATPLRRLLADCGRRFAVRQGHANDGAAARAIAGLDAPAMRPRRWPGRSPGQCPCRGDRACTRCRDRTGRTLVASSPGESPGRGRRPRTRRRRRASRATISIGVPGGEYFTALSTRFTSSCSISTASTWTSGRRRRRCESSTACSASAAPCA